MATGEGFPIAIVVLYSLFYCVVFLLSVVGNVVVLCICYRMIKINRQSSIKFFIANLAFSDLTFTLLSLLNCINFFWTWLGGNATCKLQGFLIEACYTTSIMTLVVISFERRKAVVTPFEVRMGASEGTHRNLIAAIWLTGFMTASPLLHAYEVETTKSGSLICSNDPFGDPGRQVYYSIHAVCIFIVPLTYMIYAQRTIFKTLRSRVFPIQNSFTTASTDRHRKVAKTLAALTVAFTVCWAPFIIVRTLMYFYLTDGGYYWRACQLLIFLNAALDPILYGIYGENVRGHFQYFFRRIRRSPTFTGTECYTTESQTTKFPRKPIRLQVRAVRVEAPNSSKIHSIQSF
ncbi:QRFP-like peptide receptor [Montipora foliosa]|uniref:QRFP-like peptide receptor n=1 Tax=Montipora foliosa TaxID=591990 RepID=UPI0035F20559